MSPGFPVPGTLCITVIRWVGDSPGFVPGTRYPLHYRNSLGWKFHRGTRYPLHYRNSPAWSSGSEVPPGYPVPRILCITVMVCRPSPGYPVPFALPFSLFWSPGLEVSRGYVPGTRYPLHYRNSLGWFHRGTRYRFALPLFARLVSRVGCASWVTRTQYALYYGAGL